MHAVAIGAQAVARRVGTAAADLDPAYARGLAEAYRHGVEVLCYGCDIDIQTLRIGRPIPWTDAD